MKSKKKKACQDDRLRGINDFTCRVKPEKGVSPLNISLEPDDVKKGLESAMTILFQSLAEIHRLQREAREGRDE